MKTPDSLHGKPHNGRPGGVEFNIRGLAQLASAHPDIVPYVFPESYANIPVKQRWRRLHFLHGTDVPEAEGTRVGSYVVGYAGGQRQEIPVVYGQNVLTWLAEGESAGVLALPVAWKTDAPGGITVRLCRLAWENPRPDTVIDAIDFVSKMTQAAPLLIAITAEP